MYSSYLALVTTLVVVSTEGGSVFPVPERALLAVRDAGVDSITSGIEKLNTDFTEAIEAFRPVNTTCMQQLNQAISTCTSCVTGECEARLESVCTPEESEKALGKLLEAVKDIPKFLFKQVPDVVFEELPGKLIDITKDIHDFLKDKVIGEVVDEVVDVSKKLGKGVIDVAKGLGKGVGDLGVNVVKKVGRVVERVGKEAGRVVKKVGREIGRVGKQIGRGISRVFRKLFGRRRRRDLASSDEVKLLVKRSAEPDCEEFDSNLSEVCNTYLHPSFCPTCTFDPMTSCDGYAEGLQKIEEAEEAREWLLTISNNEYNVLNMTFSLDNTGQFVNVSATVDLFGKEFTLDVGSVNPYLPGVAGPAVANQALEMYKNSV